MRVRPGRFGRRAVGVGVVIAVAAAAVAFGAIPGSGGVINGCYLKVGGVLRVIDSEAGQTCTKYETPIKWSQVGPAGPTGPKGAIGATGATGPKGDSGATGLAGSAGPRGDTGATGDQGPAGAKGDTGLKGDTGPTGDQGPAGPKGDPGMGLGSFNDVDGMPCTRTGVTGQIALSYSPEGDVSLRCSVPAAQLSNLRLTLQPPGTVSGAGHLFYTIKVFNSGQVTAANSMVRLTVQPLGGGSLPNLVSVSPGCTSPSVVGTVDCTVGDLASGAEKSYTIESDPEDVSPLFGQSYDLRATATATTTTTESTLGDNQQQATTHVGP